MDQGSGAGLTPRTMGELGGEVNVTLLSTQLASHAHTAHAGVAGNAVTPDPTKTFGSGGRGKPATYGAAPPPNSALMSAQAVGLTGGNQPHNNMPPYLTLNFIIAMTGIYPARG
jgi:microcystin-dependent protein